MSEIRSFARDWQLLKLSRDWKPADRSSEILGRLIQDNDPVVIEKIEKIVKDIGKKDAGEILKRMHPKMDINAILEGILLVSGIAYETVSDGDVKKILVRKEMKNAFSEIALNPQLSAVYIRGFMESVMPGLEITDKGDYFLMTLK